MNTILERCLQEAEKIPYTFERLRRIENQRHSPWKTTREEWLAMSETEQIDATHWIAFIYSPDDDGESYSHDWA